MSDSHNHHHHHSRHSDRKRSRPPYTRDRNEVKRRRSRSPYRKAHDHHLQDPPTRLPFKQKPLDKKEFEQYKALFADYLDIQKQLDIDELSEHEVRGRWKSFLGKWNKAELAEGWYDPDTKTKADERWDSRPEWRAPTPEVTARDLHKAGEVEEDDEDEDDDGYGPALPSKRAGASIPSLDDLQHRRELADEDRSARTADLRHERKQDRNLQKERVEEMAPRADPGSKERQLEKKRDAAAVNREYKAAKDGGDVEVGDKELMGDDGIDGYKAKMKAEKKRKNEREIRKEEVLRAREAEREEKRAELRRKEEKTMEMLRNIAQQRFG
ncbi:Hypothetical predicted protein [Lecanosticta acicola]|uniref:Uncharacterized protein n=1 Tax=Lecanosticta acicola TaxID=111012 RepID=A0AAI9E8U7_9PEZI|nr:Hypothetical predicted protein [Lecanosticta acicola]